jgi:hypothetical protein
MARRTRRTNSQDSATRGGATAEGEPNETGYFRQILRENPRLIKTRSNAELLRRWLADNPDHTEVPHRIKIAMANAKSAMRQKLRQRRRKRLARAEQAGEATPRPARLAPITIHRLESLEEQIDDCIGLAKTLDRDGLQSIIKTLRRARNEVVLKLG